MLRRCRAFLGPRGTHLSDEDLMPSVRRALVLIELGLAGENTLRRSFGVRTLSRYAADVRLHSL